MEADSHSARAQKVGAAVCALDCGKLSCCMQHSYEHVLLDVGSFQQALHRSSKI